MAAADPEEEDAAAQNDNSDGGDFGRDAERKDESLPLTNDADANDRCSVAEAATAISANLSAGAATAISAIHPECTIAAAEVGADEAGGGKDRNLRVRNEAPSKIEVSRLALCRSSSASNRGEEEVDGGEDSTPLAEIGAEHGDAKALASRIGASDGRGAPRGRNRGDELSSPSSPWRIGASARLSEESAWSESDPSPPSRRGSSNVSCRTEEGVDVGENDVLWAEIGANDGDAEVLARRGTFCSAASGTSLPAPSETVLGSSAAASRELLPPSEDDSRPGAVYVRRGAGRFPTLLHRVRSRASGPIRSSLLGSMSSASGVSSLGGGRRRSSRSSRLQMDVLSSAVVEVTTAELAPGEAEQGTRVVPSTSARAGTGTNRGRNEDAPVLEGVLMDIPEKVRGRRRSPNAKEGIIFLFDKRVCVAIAMGVVAVAIAITALLRPWKVAESRLAESGTAAKDLLLEILEQLSSPEALKDTQSPQGRAFLWLVDDGHFLSPSSSATWLLDDPPRLLQRYALAVLYYSTDGPMSWSNQLGFLSSDHECEWHLGSDGVICNNSSEVVELLTGQNNLTGTIPGAEFVAFPSLKFLDMGSNRLRGAIPSELGTLQNLQTLRLDRNSFSGPLMDNIGDLGTLAYMNIGFNNLNSTIPPSIAKLHLLEHLDFNDNMFTGPIPSTIGNMSSLKQINFNFNRLSSTLPPSWTLLDQLEVLYIDGNELSGPLPVSSTGNQNLRWFFAGSNYLTGTIPSSLGDLPQLSVLLLFKNQLHGSIPDSLSNLTQLEALALGSNNLNGTIPASIFRSATLMAVGVGDNELTGTLPNDVGNPSGLLLVSVERNLITGTIPSTYGNLPSLLALSLYGNHLSGTIPPSLGNNTESLGLMLENNILTGTLPESLANLNKARWMSFARNDLTGNLNSICVANVFEARIVTADCSLPDFEVSCDCCICCNDAVDGCDFHVDLAAYVRNCLSDGSCDFFSDKPGNP